MRVDKPKFPATFPLVLEDHVGYVSPLITLKTSKRYRNEAIRQIRTDLEPWLNNKDFLELRIQTLDLAIVADLPEQRYKNQDLDNIAKVVLDALKKSSEPEPYLFEKDSQITRLLLYKRKRKELEGYDTSQLHISFRKHAPEKSMILYENHL
jgi:Holliday junction resolvase RusA-like endonuclease